MPSAFKLVDVLNIYRRIDKNVLHLTILNLSQVQRKSMNIVYINKRNALENLLLIYYNGFTYL